VTRADVTRLVTHTNLGPGAFLELLAPDQVDLVGEPESLAELPGGPRVVVLARHGGACVFLKADSTGSESCSVHAARPLSCRAYPFDRPERGAETVGLHPDALCPPETGHLAVVQAGGDDSREWAAVVAERDRELYEHATWLDAFNRRQRQRRRLSKPRHSEAAFLDRLGSSERAESALHLPQVGGPEQVEMNE
jgi:Fe-S-cluster containining protein